jgi:hypothetical protein
MEESGTGLTETGEPTQTTNTTESSRSTTTRGGHTEGDKTGTHLEGTKQLETEADLATANAQIRDLSSCMAGDVKVSVKTESGDTGGTDAATDTKQDDDITETEKEIRKIFNILLTDTKSMLVNVSETLTTAKEIYEATKPDTPEKRYFGIIHNALTN